MLNQFVGTFSAAVFVIIELQLLLLYIATYSYSRGRFLFLTVAKLCESDSHVDMRSLFVGMEIVISETRCERMGRSVNVVC